MSPVRPLLLGSFIAISVISLYHIVKFFVPPARTSRMSLTAYGVLPHPLAATPQLYEPKRSDLQLTVLRNARVEPEGFTLAIFKDRTLVDAQGQLHTLSEERQTSILDLATKVAALPKTDQFRNQWRVAQATTSFPIERILSPKSTLSETPAEDYDTEFDETSVYGYSKVTRKLEKETNGFEELPEVLYELLGFSLEARKEGAERDEVVLQKVRSVLGNVF